MTEQPAFSDDADLSDDFAGTAPVLVLYQEGCPCRDRLGYVKNRSTDKVRVRRF